MKNVIILGAAGRDFHNFNTYFKNNHDYKVIAFTAAQIPNIDKRTYPIQLTGKYYPNGIPILPEADLPYLIKKHNIDECIFSYSDVSNAKLMQLAAVVQSAGADFRLLGPNNTMLKSLKPVVAVCATRTGSGKSQTSRRVSTYLKSKGYRVIVIRHPMPYGDLKKQIVQRFATLNDVDEQECTIEEREEYESHIKNGIIVYSGIDFHDVLREVEEDEKGCDVIVWDGGNNDMPFYKPDLMITVADPHRLGHETSYYPSEVNVRISNAVIINKIDTALPTEVNQLRRNIKNINSEAKIIEAASPLMVNNSEEILGKKVLVVEDGPTLTHGEMKVGAGFWAAEKYGAVEVVDPRQYAVGSIEEVYQKYYKIGPVLPAVGYSEQQIKDLEATIEATPCDVVMVATPFDLSRLIKVSKPIVKVNYELQEIGQPNLATVLDAFIEKYL